MTTDADQASVASEALADGRVDRSEIPSRKVGVRRRMKMSEVLLYREVDQARRLKAVAKLAAEAQELGVY
ncbi:MAG: hypothetical protein ACR2MB_12175 [Acidimicrobiales bacterium]